MENTLAAIEKAPEQLGGRKRADKTVLSRAPEKIYKTSARSLMEVEYDEKETDLGAIVKALEPFYLVTVESDRSLEQR